jgi:hypothetical protein
MIIGLSSLINSFNYQVQVTAIIDFIIPADNYNQTLLITAFDCNYQLGL